MMRKLLLKRKPVLISLFIVALAGAIFFLPMHINGSYTCFYHRLFDADHPAHPHHADGTEAVTDQNGMDHHSGELMDMYIGHYAIFWWSSVALAAFSVYRLRLSCRDPKTNPAN